MSHTGFGLAAALAVALGLGVASFVGRSDAQGTQQGNQPDAQSGVSFTPEFLRDPENVEKGREFFQSRCKFCHGKTAYPGKAPRLEPSRYTPEFVYDRVTNGFNAMPSWKHEFDEQQRKQIAAYVMSPDFSN